MTNSLEDSFNDLMTDNINEQRPVLIPLLQHSILEISGDDAVSFLQNLLTNDVDQITKSQAQLTGFCNPKGRLIALFWLIKHQDNHFFALLPNSVADILLKRLSLFKLRSKVDIKDASAIYTAFGLLPQSSSLANAVKLSTKLNAEVVIVENEQASDYAKQLLDEDWQMADSAMWEQQTINAGIPSVYAETSEAFTPQQLNLDLINGVSFQKGCYPGQEVVARLHYLGNPSRRLFLIEYAGNKPLANSVITDDAENTIGHVVSSTENYPLALASLKLSESDKPLFIESNRVTIKEVLTDEN